MYTHLNSSKSDMLGGTTSEADTYENEYSVVQPWTGDLEIKILKMLNIPPSQNSSS